MSMGGSLYYGKNLRLEPPGDDGGKLALRGSIDCLNISWLSIRELKDLARQHLGIQPEDWPFYDEVELVQDFPLEDVRAKCMKLRAAFARHSFDEIPENDWLRFFARILHDGADFCVKSY